ncbi:MAG: hypothetical protein AB7I37_27320 [Pirellulales bacterium]
MRTRQLYQAVARATGEPISTIKRLGFLLADPAVEVPDADHEQLGPYVIDWDQLQADRDATLDATPEAVCPAVA